MGTWYFWGRWQGSALSHWTHMKAFLSTQTTYDNINGPGTIYAQHNWSGRTTYEPGPNISLQAVDTLPRVLI